MIISSERLIKSIYETVVEGIQDDYKETFEKTIIERVKDEDWKRILKKYSEFTSDNKEVFLKVMNQVVIDIVYNTFGIFDKRSSYKGEEFEFSIKFEENNNKLNGNLQDVFLKYIKKNHYDKYESIVSSGYKE